MDIQFSDSISDGVEQYAFWGTRVFEIYVYLENDRPCANNVFAPLSKERCFQFPIINNYVTKISFGQN